MSAAPTSSAVDQVRFAPMALLGGVACGVGTVAVYQSWCGLALGTAVTLLTAFAAPAGWGTRLPFAVGDTVVVGALSVPRGEGDYLVGSTTGGYLVLALALALLVFSLVTLPRPTRRPRPASQSPEADTPIADAGSAEPQ